MQDNQDSSDGQMSAESEPGPSGAGADDPQLGHDEAEPAQPGYSIQPTHPQPADDLPQYGQPGPGYGQPGPRYGELGGPGHRPPRHEQPGHQQPGYGQP